MFIDKYTLKPTYAEPRSKQYYKINQRLNDTFNLVEIILGPNLGINSLQTSMTATISTNKREISCGVTPEARVIRYLCSSLVNKIIDPLGYNII